MSTSTSSETVVLVLKDVFFRHTEAHFLSDIIAEKYGFKKEEEKIKEIAKTKRIIVKDTGETSEDLEQKLEETTKYSTTKSLSGNFSDAAIKIHFLGELAQTEDIIEIDGVEKYRIYNSKYQLIKISSKSGYAITQLIERLKIDLGLEIETREWFFHRGDNA